MVTHTEMGRYLEYALTWLRHITDDFVYVHDDRSSDGTAEYIEECGVPLSVRSTYSMSFAENESILRGSAWHHMEAHFNPTPSDWILCVDADEFVVAHQPGDTHDTLTDVIERANQYGAVTLPVREVFGFHGEVPLLRVDGYWGEIVARRLVRWRPGAQFHDRTQGGGSLPTGWSDKHCETDDLSLLHLGYAREEDRRAKHARYSSTVGHNPRHVASILEAPSLVPWPGMDLFWTRS